MTDKQIMNERIKQSKYKIGDVVIPGYTTVDGARTRYPYSATITDVVYDTEKHTPDTHMYVVSGPNGESGLWFESELTLYEVEE